MAKKIFIAATGQNCGKTTTSIGLMHLAKRKYSRVGFIKPLGPKPASYHRVTVDKDAALIAQVFELEKDLRWMSPVVVYPDTTRRVVDGEISPKDFHERIMRACAELEKRCDLIIIEGSGAPRSRIGHEDVQCAYCEDVGGTGANGHRWRPGKCGRQGLHGAGRV